MSYVVETMEYAQVIRRFQVRVPDDQTPPTDAAAWVALTDDDAEQVDYWTEGTGGRIELTALVGPDGQPIDLDPDGDAALEERDRLIDGDDFGLDREALTDRLLAESLCPLHRVDYAICFDDEDPECAVIRTIHPSHST